MQITADNVKTATVTLLIILVSLHFISSIFIYNTFGIGILNPVGMPSDFVGISFLIILTIDLILILYIIILFINFYNVLSLKSLFGVVLIGLLSFIIRTRTLNILSTRYSNFIDSINFSIEIITVLFGIVVVISSVLQFLAITAFYILKPKKLGKLSRISLFIVSLVNAMVFAFSYYIMLFSGFAALFYIVVSFMSRRD